MQEALHLLKEIGLALGEEAQITLQYVNTGYGDALRVEIRQIWQGKMFAYCHEFSGDQISAPNNLPRQAYWSAIARRIEHEYRAGRPLMI